MPVYVYETLPAAGKKPRRFELKQSMHDAPLTHDPETGEPVKRVITGGDGFYGASADKPAPPAGPCGGECRCFGAN